MSCQPLRCCDDPLHVSVTGHYPLKDDEGNDETNIRGLEFAVCRPGHDEDDWEYAGFIPAPQTQYDYVVPSDGQDGDYFFKYRAVRNAVVDPSCGRTHCTRVGHWSPVSLRVTVIAAPPACPPKPLVLVDCPECKGHLGPSSC